MASTAWEEERHSSLVKSYSYHDDTDVRRRILLDHIHCLQIAPQGKYTPVGAYLASMTKAVSGFG